MTTPHAILLGLIQGVAEFLPISSSGHLSLFQNFWGITSAEDSCLLFDVMLHFGTLISVFIVYWQDIINMFRECISFIKEQGHPVPGEKKRFPSLRLLMLIVFATLPLFFLIPFRSQIEKLYYHTGFIGFSFIITGCILFISDHLAHGTKDEKNMRVSDALIIGVCQGLATIPGLSRSGTTICAGLSVGLKRQFSVKFSFLISIPAILGANIISLIKSLSHGVDWLSMPKYLLGTLVAMISGYLALSFLKYIAQKGRFIGFAYYCWLVGTLTLVLTVIF